VGRDRREPEVWKLARGCGRRGRFSPSSRQCQAIHIPSPRLWRLASILHPQHADEGLKSRVCTISVAPYAGLAGRAHRFTTTPGCRAAFASRQAFAQGRAIGQQRGPMRQGQLALALCRQGRIPVPEARDHSPGRSIRTSLRAAPLAQPGSARKVVGGGLRFRAGDVVGLVTAAAGSVCFCTLLPAVYVDRSCSLSPLVAMRLPMLLGGGGRPEAQRL